ncbi:glycoside hydrolase family 16 protein [Bipolaris zeicola 26-R-13]|uniref:chitinase n=1 Tax=Cochliobolus carbonum (strain 26-R-13) TaxID=930089 RepID=W6Y0J6_COCC2|nr:glycoside hydrolase family 16 protein [Bipolaris zeicola 26-R-13]EUC31513.1 glycoside hydrolase family 16 protein [Bipolaris zeicola 26-R-13]
MKSFAVSAAAIIAGLVSTTIAQTHTDCYPLNTTNCPDMEALGGNVTFLWNKTGIPQDDKIWKMPNQGKIDWVEKGATFTIERSGDSPTANSVFYMLFGRLEVIMKVATGTGIISSAILQSEALDEIDWEFIGDKKTILTNYFGKGDTSTYDRGKDFELDFAPQDDFHNYTINWNKTQIDWFVDGKNIRTLTPEEAKGGTRYPQTPMSIRLGAWAAGDPSKNDPGVVKWAGGETDFSKGPYTMTIQSVYAQDYTSAAKYSWENMDSSGDWEKVKVIEGKSEVLEEIQSPHGVRNRFAALSPGAKAGIAIGAVSAFAIGALVILFCCIKQRRIGRKEHEALLAEEQKEAAELNEYKSQMQAGRFAVGGGAGRV